MRVFIASSQPTPAQIDAAVAQFAEYQALDVPLTEIARLMQVSIGTACVLLRLLCERMGEAAQ